MCTCELDAGQCRVEPTSRRPPESDQPPIDPPFLPFKSTVQVSLAFTLRVAAAEPKLLQSPSQDDRYGLTWNARRSAVERLWRFWRRSQAGQPAQPVAVALGMKLSCFVCGIVCNCVWVFAA